MIFRQIAILGVFFLLAGCVLPGNLYLVAEGGYQDIEFSETAPDEITDEGVFEGASLIYGGGIGYGVSLLKFYGGAEVNLSYSSFDEEITYTDPVAESASADQVITQREESWTLNAVADAGFYLTSDVLLFARAGYVYVDADTEVRAVDENGVLIDATAPSAGDFARQAFDSASRAFDTDEASAFAIGGGLEYEIGLGLGVRGVYLYHTGDRDAHDVRMGIVWRF